MGRIIITYVLLTLSLTSCYQNNANDKEIEVSDSTFFSTEEDSPSSAFYSAHHYGIGYNFIVNSDSLLLIKGQPEEYVAQLPTDSISIPQDKHIAVSDIRIIPQDSIDSVWIQLIAEDGTTGWNHEKEVLKSAVGADPISRFIMIFSNTHLIIALIIVAIISTTYIVRKIKRQNAPTVHFRDIPSFYPTLLCIIVASSATLYASLQMFSPNTWQHFYFHPSLNPFSMPLILGIFISSVWAMLIIGLAAIDDIYHMLSFSDAILYVIGLCGVNAILYIVFSISTLYYIGYPLLVLYCVFAINKYIKNQALQQ